jgi:hypothetical protein
VDYLILANLNAFENSTPIMIPWNIIINYGLLDWDNDADLSDPLLLPDKNQMIKLQESGFLKVNGFDFTWGLMEVYLKKTELDKFNSLVSEVSNL